MSLTTLLTWSAPGVLVVLPAAIWLLAAPDSAALAQAAHGYPYAALLLALLLAWRFQRSRIAAAALALALVPLLSRPWSGLRATNVETAAALVLAPLLATLAFCADRRLGAPRGVAQLLAGPALAVVLTLAAVLAPAATADWLGGAPIDRAYTDWTGLTQPALAGALLGLAVLAALTVLRQRALEAGLAWAALAGTFALASAPDSPARGVWLLAAALSLGVGLVETSYAMAFRDDLTGLPGRRALRELLTTMRAPYCVAVVDVDRFKSFNDRYGHDVGDQVLRLVAAKLAAVGGGGRAFRSGGEEFTIVFAGRVGAEALPHLDELRRDIATTGFTLRRATRSGATGRSASARRGQPRAARRQLRVTVSIGVATVGGRNRSAHDVVKSADKAMYRAKQGGRNRVVA